MPTAPKDMPKLADYMRRAEEDRTLLLGISSGKEEAFTLLYDEYAPMLLAFAAKMLRSMSDAEEVVQELFQDVWRNVFSAMEGTVHSLVVSSLRERALSRLRARGHRRPHQGSELQSVTLFPESGGVTGGGIARAEVIAALRSAGKEEQQVLALAFYEGFTESEIAGMVRRPKEDVRKQLGTALLTLHHATPWHESSALSHDGLSPESYASRVLHSLDGEDARRFDAHLALPCDACLLRLRSLKQTSALLPIVLMPVTPSPDLKERILFSIRLSRVAEAELALPEESESRPSAVETPLEAQKEGGKSPWLMIAGVFVALVILVGMAAYVNTLIETVSGQHEFILGQDGRLATLKSELNSKRSIAAVLGSPRLVLVGLEGLPPAKESRGNLFWDAQSERAVLQVSRLPELPDEMEYRLWVVLKDKSVLRSALTTVSGPDSLATYLTVIPMPQGEGDRADFVTIVRVRKSDGPEASGEMCLHGVVPRSIPGQRMK